MSREADAHFHAFDEHARAGGRYWFRLDGDRLRPDPASRHQPDGPHEPSAYVDPARLPVDRRGPRRGCGRSARSSTRCTSARSRPKGRGARPPRELDELARIGITVIEMMPIAEFPGRFGWGYDGVDLYAPGPRLRHARRPARVRRPRARARPRRDPGRRLQPSRPGRQLPERLFTRLLHRQVHERLGPGDQFRGARRRRASSSCRTRGYWIDEFHFDGLRLDATQDIKDDSPASRAGRHRLPRRERPRACVRSTSSPRTSRRTRSSSARRTKAAMARTRCGTTMRITRAMVALTGRREAYYMDYLGTPQELSACARFGYLYQGQWYAWQEQPRGTPALDLAAGGVCHLPGEPRPGRELRRPAAGCTSWRRRRRIAR